MLQKVQPRRQTKPRLCLEAHRLLLYVCICVSVCVWYACMFVDVYIL